MEKKKRVGGGGDAEADVLMKFINKRNYNGEIGLLNAGYGKRLNLILTGKYR